MHYFFILLITILFVIFLLEMRHSLRRSNFNSSLIAQYRDDLHNPQLITDIYNYCQQDYKLRRIIREYDVTIEDIAQLYKKLLLWGNFHKGRRFVPITSFLYVYTLKHLVTHKDAEAKELTMKCMNFFHI